MKKILALILALLMAFSCCAVSFAESDTEADIDQTVVDELMNGMNDADAKEAYMSYARLCAMVVSVMSSQGYDLGHTPFALCVNQKNYSTDAASLSMLKAVVRGTDSWSLGNAKLNTTSFPWSTIKSLRGTYTSFQENLAMLDSLIANKPAVPADCARIDETINKAHAALTSLSGIVVNFYTTAGGDPLDFWGKCEAQYQNSDVILLKAMYYFE